MSFKTWLKEYYPIPVEDLHPNTSTKELIEHSLRKWIGLRKENLLRHKCSVENRIVKDNNILTAGILIIDSDSCSLCRKFLDYDKFENSSCEKCPLYRILGHACDHEKLLAPYRIWALTKNPEQMITALETALKYESST